MNKNINLQRYKEQALNITIILVALLVAAQVYNVQNKRVKSVFAEKDARIKKNELLSEIGRSKERLDAYGGVFNQQDMSSVINTINTLTKDSGVGATSIRPQADEEYGQYLRRYPFLLTVSADDYHALGRFISKIENYPDILQVERIVITVAPDFLRGRQIYKLGAQLTINSSSFKEE